VRAVKERAEMSLLALPGVTGVDIGPKVVAGKATDRLAIRVYVASKGDVPSKQQIPAEIEGIPTDVIERRFVLHPGQAAAPPKDVSRREAGREPGTSAFQKKEKRE
jgi:hypothetical protein